MSVLVYSLFAQIEGEEKAFFGEWKKGEPHRENTPKSAWFL